jgi:hypothetical protein
MSNIVRYNLNKHAGQIKENEKGEKVAGEGNIYNNLVGILRKKIQSGEFEVSGIILKCTLKEQVACMWIALIPLQGQGVVNTNMVSRIP